MGRSGDILYPIGGELNTSISGPRTIPEDGFYFVSVRNLSNALSNIDFKINGFIYKSIIVDYFCGFREFIYLKAGDKISVSSGTATNMELSSALLKNPVLRKYDYE